MQQGILVRMKKPCVVCGVHDTGTPLCYDRSHKITECTYVYYTSKQGELCKKCAKARNII